MIRRDQPLGAASPGHWLLIPQPEHARVSWALANAWGGGNAPPLVCPDGDRDNALVDAKRELLQAVLHHDDGWLDYAAAPLVDAPTGRPLAFTEMPADAAQRLWTDSIDACRAIGPLAGWVVASHFSALQSKHDEDYPLWVDWLARVDARRAEWLADWLALSDRHTADLAARCLVWLQAFDWMSLWLGCVCPALPDDAPAEPLTLGDRPGWPTVRFAPAAAGPPGGDRLVRVDPWPFTTPTLELRLDALSVPADRYDPARGGRPTPLAWRLAPGDG